MSKNDEAKEREQRRHEVSRSAQFFSLLIAALAVLNGLLYWERGSALFLALGLVAAVALVGWILYSRSVLKKL
jgi:hypothetical protein